MPHRIEISHYGPPEVLQLVERPLPPLGPDEVRFRVLAAAVNHADLEIRAGHWQILAPHPFPYTPGLEAVGEVIEVGRAVERVHVGDRVITMMQKLGGIHGIRPGGYQEVVTVKAETVALLPPHLDPLTIAALGASAGDQLLLSAWDLLQDLHLTGYSSENLTGADLREDMQLSVGMMLFPDLTLLDLAGPFEVFSRMPGVRVHLKADPRSSPDSSQSQPKATWVCTA